MVFFSLLLWSSRTCSARIKEFMVSSVSGLLKQSVLGQQVWAAASFPSRDVVLQEDPSEVGLGGLVPVWECWESLRALQEQRSGFAPSLTQFASRPCRAGCVTRAMSCSRQ